MRVVWYRGRRKRERRACVRGVEEWEYSPAPPEVRLDDRLCLEFVAREVRIGGVPALQPLLPRQIRARRSHHRRVDCGLNWLTIGGSRLRRQRLLDANSREDWRRAWRQGATDLLRRQMSMRLEAREERRQHGATALQRRPQRLHRRDNRRRVGRRGGALDQHDGGQGRRGDGIRRHV